MALVLGLFLKTENSLFSSKSTTIGPLAKKEQIIS